MHPLVTTILLAAIIGLVVATLVNIIRFVRTGTFIHERGPAFTAMPGALL